MRIRTAALLTTSALVFASLAMSGAEPVHAFQDGQAGRVMDLRFGGGTATQYIDVIRKAAPSANIVVMSDAKAVTMPALEVQGVTIGAALGLLDGQRSIQGNAWVKLNLEHKPGATHGGGNDIYVVHAERQSMFNAAPVQSWSVVSVAQILNHGVEAENLLAAIDAALAMVADGGPAPQVKFHEATGILLIQGTEPQLELIHNVINEVLNSALVPQHEQERGARLLELQERNATLLSTIEALESEVRSRTQNLLEVRTRLDFASQQAAVNEDASRDVVQWQTKSQLLEQELDQLRRTIDRRDGEYRQLMDRYNDVRRELDSRAANSDG